MPRRPPQIVLTASSIPDRAGLFRGVRRWLDREQGLRVCVYPGSIAGQAHSLPCDGLITDRSISSEASLRKAGVPVVSITDRADTETYTVAFDDRAVGRAAADHFLEQGHWQFACVTYGALEIGWETERERGFSERLAEAGRSYTRVHVNDFPLDPRSPQIMTQHDAVRQRAIAAFLKALPKPLAVFAGDDTLAVIVADACARARISIPADIALLGVNNDPMCELSGPPLSSVALPSEQVGYEAIATISALLRGHEDVRRRTLLPPVGVVVRSSSDALQVRDPIVAQALRYIRDHPREAVSIKELAAHVAASRRTLERRFRDAVGRTPGEEVQRLRAGLWRRLLTETDLTMAEIAERCGFGTPASFSTAVRRTEGVAPAEYRSRTQGSKASDAI